MELNYELREGSQENEPQLIDTSSSNTVVYVRRNVREIERTDEMSGDTIHLWQYEEAELTRREFENYFSQVLTKDRADIEFIAMVSDIDLED